MLLGTGAVVLYIGSFIGTVGALAIEKRDQVSAKWRPIADLGYAKYQGVRPDTGVDQFLGMRYANAPLGNLRFWAPEDPEAEPEIQDASKVSLSGHAVVDDVFMLNTY